MITTMMAPKRVPDFLFGSQGEAVEEVSRSVDHSHLLKGSGVVAKLAAGPRGIISSQVARAVISAVDVEVGDLVLAGWRRHSSLVDAAQRSRAAGSEELVDLATHKITSTHQPYVEILVDEIAVAKIDVELRFDFLLKGIIASVTAGYLTGLHSGACEATGVLTVQGAEFARKQGSIDLGLSLRLRDAIPLDRSE